MVLMVVGAFAAGAAFTAAAGLLYGLKIRVRRVREGYMFEIIEDLGKVYNSAVDVIKSATKLAESAARKLAQFARRANDLIKQCLLGDVMTRLNDASTRAEGDGLVKTMIRHLCARIHNMCEELLKEALQGAENIEYYATYVSSVANLFLAYLDALPPLVYQVRINGMLSITER